MKKLTLIFITIIGLGLLISCEKELREPVLDMTLTEKATITNPANGSSYVLTKNEADNVFTNFQWSAVKYNFNGLEATKYALQIDIADSNFINAQNLVTTTNTSFEITVGAMNQKLIGLGLIPNQAGDVAFKIYSYINTDTDYSDVYSNPITLTVTPYEDIVFVKPIYLLGDATPAGWDNIAALAMAHIGEGRYARVEYLDPGIGDWFKFISILGLWAPQWGTDDTGTPEAGPLVYRPDEATPDPPAIPVPTVAGNYYIEADTVNLEYETFLTSGELYLVGDATSVGWDNTAGLPFTEDPDTAHIFTITTNLNADGGMKFLEVLGEWAPQWGTDESGTAEEGDLIYRPTESVPDPTNIPAPGTAGQYKITVDLRKLTYTITLQ